MAEQANVSFSWLRPVDEIVHEKVLLNGKTPLFMATSWFHHYDQFVPMDTGHLAHDTVEIKIEGNVGIIQHNAKYANDVYYGTKRRYSKTKHHFATAMWDEAAKSAGKATELVHDVEMFIKRGSG